MADAQAIARGAQPREGRSGGGAERRHRHQPCEPERRNRRRRRRRGRRSRPRRCRRDAGRRPGSVAGRPPAGGRRAGAARSSGPTSAPRSSVCRAKHSPADERGLVALQLADEVPARRRRGRQLLQAAASFEASSCARFSPMSRTPNSCSSATSLAGKVFVTVMIVRSFGPPAGCGRGSRDALQDEQRAGGSARYGGRLLLASGKTQPSITMRPAVRPVR